MKSVINRTDAPCLGESADRILPASTLPTHRAALGATMKRTVVLIAAAVCAAALAYAAETRKCTASAKECEYQIREMLADKRYLGAKVEDSRWGVVVTEVISGSPAHSAGLSDGDRIFAVNGRECTKGGMRKFKALLNQAATQDEGGKVSLTIVRSGRLMRISARLSVMSKKEIDKVVAAHIKEAHPEHGN